MKNKKVLIRLALVIVVVLVIFGIVKLVKNGGEKTIDSQLGESIWLKANETVNLSDNGKNIKLSIESDLDFDKTSEDYKYEVPYVLNVDGQDYLGSHTFAVGYSVHSESNDMPYKVSFVDFEQGTVEVIIDVKDQLGE